MILDLGLLIGARVGIGLLFIALESVGLMLALNVISYHVGHTRTFSYADCFAISCGIAAIVSGVMPLISRLVPAKTTVKI
jgi:hypothetical protein